MTEDEVNAMEKAKDFSVPDINIKWVDSENEPEDEGDMGEVSPEVDEKTETEKVDDSLPVTEKDETDSDSYDLEEEEA